MFSLVITVVSIALVAALALAVLYYGGKAFARGSDTAQAAELINTGSQMAGAFALYYASQPAGITQAPLTASGFPPSEYLTSVPQGWSSACDGSLCHMRKNLGQSGEVLCKEVNKKAGIGFTTEVTVYAQATSVFSCSPVNGSEGQAVDYTFHYLYRNSA